jgi:Zn-dependent protease
VDTANLAQKSLHQCPDCKTELGPGALCCPACKRLIYKERLQELATQAQEAHQKDALSDELGLWREALELLPPESGQFAAIQSKMSVISKEVDKRGLPNKPKEKNSVPTGWLASLGVVGVIIWKFKFALVFILTKAKFLLLGLTKASTLFSMLLSFSIYWNLWGWKFALGLIVSIYIHEIGHVVALHRFGIKATAPMFIPGFGALIRSKGYPTDPREDARIGLAGPIWGLGAALAAYGLYYIFDAPSFAAIARVGAWINLFNLTPIWQLDGHHAFRALDKKHRILACAVLAGCLLFTHEGLLFLLIIFAAFQVFQKNTPVKTDTRSFIEYSLLAIILSAMCKLHVPH